MSPELHERTHWDRLDDLEAAVRGVCGERGLFGSQADVVWAALTEALEVQANGIRNRQRAAAADTECALRAFRDFTEDAEVRVDPGTGARRVNPGRGDA